MEAAMDDKSINKTAEAECIEKYKAAAKKVRSVTNEEYDAFLQNILDTVK
jgi:hypothetical protein